MCLLELLFWFDLLAIKFSFFQCCVLVHIDPLPTGDLNMVVNVDSGQTVEGMKQNIVDTARTALPVSYCCI